MQTVAIVALSGPGGDESSETPNPSEHRLSHNRGLFHGTQGLLDSVLGHNLLQRTIARLDECGVARTTVVPQNPALREPLTAVSAEDSFFSAWDRAAGRAVQQGARNILVLRANQYVELDFAELIRAHVERAAGLTQVSTDQDLLDVAVINVEKLCAAGQSFRSGLAALSPRRQRFLYRGYVNHLQKPADYMRLMEDALHLRCELRPVGTEVKPGIWLGDDARVNDSSVLEGPCFIGSGTRIGASCKIADGCAVERGCEIDSGTTIEHSWILPGTYVGVGLNVRRSILKNNRMFHLDRRVEVTINDRRLIGSKRPRLSFGLGTGFFSKRHLAEYDHKLASTRQ